MTFPRFPTTANARKACDPPQLAPGIPPVRDWEIDMFPLAARKNFPDRAEITIGTAFL